LGAAVAGLLAMGLLAPALSSATIAEYLFGLSAAMLLGGRLVWLGYEQRALLARPLTTLKRVGFVSFGGYAAMFAFAFVWQHFRAPSLSAAWLIDRTMAASLVCSGFGRLGCLSYGCCYGLVWQPGVHYQDARAKVIRERGHAGHQPRFPTQLLSALSAFACSALMLGVLRAGAAPGFAAELGALAYALARFHVESFRDEARFVGGRLTRGQLASMLIAGAALACLALTSGATDQHQAGAFSFEWRALLQHASLPLSAAIPVFLVCGYHRERVGSW
jgi:prolipoprotein diacylglyceryltransferase